MKDHPDAYSKDGGSRISATLLRDQITAKGEPAIFLATSQRSYVDGMKGAIVRRVAELAENLELAKKRLKGKW